LSPSSSSSSSSSSGASATSIAPADRDDPLATFGWRLGLAALAFGLGRALAVSLGFPGTALPPDVIGALTLDAADARAKAVEAGSFYYTLALLPLLFAWLGAAPQRLRAAGPAALPWLAAGGLLAFGAVAVNILAGVTGATGAWTHALPPALAMFAAHVAASRGPRIAASMRRAAKLRRLRRSDGFAAFAVATLAVAIAALAVGPRTAPDLGLVANALRIGGVIAGCGLLVAAVREALRVVTTTRPAVADVALAGLALLALIRFARESTAMWIAAGTGSLVAIVILAWHGARAAPGRKSRWIDFVALPLIVAALATSDEINGRIDLFHSGEWLTPAAEILRGEHAFRDVYLQHGWIQNALRNAVAFALGDTTYEVSRHAENLTYGIAHAATFVVLRVLLASRFVAFVLALALATPGLHVQARFIFPLVAIAAVAQHLARTRTRDGFVDGRRAPYALVVAGAAAAISGFYSLDMGVYTTAAIGLFLVIEALLDRARRVTFVSDGSRFALGLALGTAPFAAALLATDSFGAFVRNAREQVSLQLAVWGLPYPSLRDTLKSFEPAKGEALFPPPGLAAPEFLALIAGAAFLLVPAGLALLALRRPLARTEWAAMLIALCGAILFRTALGRSDEGHLAYVQIYLWLLLALLGAAAWRRAPRKDLAPTAAFLRRAAPAMALVVWLMAGFAPLYGVATQWMRLSRYRPTEGSGSFATAPLPRLGAVLLPRDQAQALASLHAFVEEHVAADETFVEFSNLGAAYFFTARDCPTRFVMPVYAATPAMQDEWIASIDRVKPRWLIRSSVLGYEEVDGIPLEERLPRIAEYLASRYGSPRDEGFGIVYERL
jgi:hypothetical protein